MSSKGISDRLVGPFSWEDDERATDLKYRMLLAKTENVYTSNLVAKVNVPSRYVAPLVRKAFASHPAFYETIGRKDKTTKYNLVWDEYENLDWQAVLNGSVIANSYCVRKGLSRKAQLALYLSKHMQKKPASILTKSFPKTLIIDTWEAYDSSLAALGIPFRQRLDSCLWEAKEKIETDPTQMWILKPSATNKGAEVCVLNTFKELRSFIHEWTDIREWVLQAYISKPLLLQNKRKFHLRVYVLAVGCLKVYISTNVLMLSALEAYDTENYANKFAHVSNTFQQQSHPDFVEEECVLLLDDLNETLRECGHDPSTAKAKILDDIGLIVHDSFEALKGEFSVFQPLPNCFEVYGVDFMIDEDINTWLLEFNPGPDFKQTGGRLQGVIECLMKDTLSIVTDHFFRQDGQQVESAGAYRKVYDEQWGAQAKEGASMKLLD